MLWLLWDILIPLAAALLVGLFIGWLLWRWRRTRIGADELATVRRSGARFKADADTLRKRNAELSERLRAASGAGDSAVVQELAAANKRIDTLRSQLQEVGSGNPMQRSRDEAGVDRGGAIKGGASRSDRAVQRPLQTGSSERVLELEGQLAAAKQRIQDLERSEQGTRQPARLRNDRVNDKAHAEVTGRNEIRLSRHSADTHYLEEIAVRDKMIETLKHSLQQYGEQQDTTALLAEIELREHKIATLEHLLGKAQRGATVYQ